MKKVLLPILLLMAISFMFAAESAPSAIVGYVKYPCVEGLNMIAIPMESGYTTAAQVGDAFPDQMAAISYWDNLTQTWVEADYFGEWVGDFPITNGEPLYIYANGTFDFFSMGSLPATMPIYGFIPGLNMMMVPLNQSALTTAAAVGDAVGAFDAISYWDALTQTWVEADYFGEWVGDFGVTIGEPLYVYANDTVSWPGAKHIQTLKASRASK